MKLIRKLIAGILILITLALPITSCITHQSIELTLRDLTWAVSAPLPRAEDFVVSLPDGYSVSFAESYSFDEIKEYRLELLVLDEKGREVERHTVTLNLIIDQQPPVINGLCDLSVSVNGGGVSYYKGISTTDNCDGTVTLRVDTSAVDLKTVGIYPVYYIATDAAGNETRCRMSISVYDLEVTEEMLWTELDPIIASIIDNGMSTKAKLREVYDYVYDNVAYTASADKSSWVRAAYEGLTTHRGDCYTYFALSKAFFVRLGIENMDIQRSADVAVLADERHFWNMVNIGTESAPQWYHFDACHIKDLPKPWGYLMTDDQLAEYTAEKVNAFGVGNYFYAFDTSAYPRTPTQKINTDY